MFTLSLSVGWASTEFGISIGFLLMFSPLISAILTKIITKDKPRDMKELYLITNFKKSKMIYFLALACGIFANLAAGIAYLVFFGGEYDAGSYIFSNESEKIISSIPMMLTQSIFFIAIFFGEEYGWRAFLTPKLEKLMPEWAAYIVSGIIWGMWHKPVLDLGQNFGKELPFFPYSNYALMCLGCIFTGMIYTWLTKKSGSVFPAALAHAALDMSSGLSLIFVPKEIVNEGSNIAVFGITAVAGAPLLIIAVYGIIKLVSKPEVKAASA